MSKISSHKNLIITICVVIVLALAVYWYFGAGSSAPVPILSDSTTSGSDALLDPQSTRIPLA